jgi:hypothetical protein
MSPPREDPAPEASSGAEALPTVDELVQAGDTEKLLELAKGYRASRDLKACLACYEAAATLGSAEAEHAVGLFLLSGGVAPKDEKRAAAMFRSAADKGHLPSRVYVANLYELGLHYKQDGAKADVWYKNAARTAQITEDPESYGYAYAMAELGCVRHCLKVIADPETSEDDRVHFARKAKAYGYREKGRETAPPPEPTATLDDTITKPERLPAPKAAATAEETAAPDKPEKKAQKKAEDEKSEEKAGKKGAKKPEKSPSSLTLGAGLVAFLWATLLVGAAVAAGYLGLEGVRLLVAKYGPILGAHEERIVLGVAAGLGALGALMVYTFKSVVQATLAAALFAGIGWFVWRAPNLHLFHLQVAQAIAFGIAGFLAALLLLGLGGGAKRRT